MPLRKSSSKKAFEHNVKAEIESGKPQKQALAIAYDIKRKNMRKKMAEGGILDTLKENVKEAFSDPTKKDKSSRGYVNRDLPPKAAQGAVKGVKEGSYFADGGQVKPKVTPVKHPRMVEGMYKVRDREDMMLPADPEERMEREEDKEMDLSSIKYKKPEKMAHGGMAHEMEDVPEEEYEMEHEDSIAAAIMARKERQKRMESDSDIDEMERYYEGGQVEGSDESMVDIMSNNKERPNYYYKRNEDEVLKENYNDGMEGVDQPEDSNEHGDDIESDAHDMISKIRAKMNKQRQFKVR